MSHPLAPHFALLLVQLFFGSLPVMGKYVMRFVEPQALVGFRIIGGAALLLVCHWVAKAPPIREKGAWGRLLMLSLLGVFFNQLLYIEGLARTTAINAAVLTTTIPVITTVLSIGFSLERFSWLKGVGIGLSLLGALRLIGIEGLDLSSQHLLGNLLVFGNTVSYSLYLVLARSLLERHPAISVITPVFWMGALLMMPVALPAWSRIDVAQVAPLAWWVAAGIVLFPTVGAYLLNIWALKRTKPSVVVVYIYLQPLVATLLGMALLGERLTVVVLQAAALTFTGVFLVGKARQYEQQEREKGTSAAVLSPPPHQSPD